MREYFTHWTDPHRPPWGGFALILLALAGLWWFVLRAEQTVSGWQDLAVLYDAGSRPLANSQGTVNVVLKRRDGTAWLLGSDRSGSGRQRFIEAGFDNDGFWLRSTRSSPRPALYIPWTDVAFCHTLTARLHNEGFEISVHHQGWADACQHAMKQRR